MVTSGIARADESPTSLPGTPLSTLSVDTPVRPEQGALWSRVGYLVETPAAYPELTALENLHLVRRLRKIDDWRAVDEVMEQLRLTPYTDRRVRTLSLGNAQRLGLAKALIHRPELLILDEASGCRISGRTDQPGQPPRAAPEQPLRISS